MKKEMKEDESTDVKVVVLKQPPKDHGTIRVVVLEQPPVVIARFEWSFGSQGRTQMKPTVLKDCIHCGAPRR